MNEGLNEAHFILNVIYANQTSFISAGFQVPSSEKVGIK